MAALFTLILLYHALNLGTAIFDNEKCIPELGCFSYAGAFFHPIYRPFQVLPSDRESINTTFRLYTRSNPTNAIILNNLDPEFSFQSTPFNADDETKIIIHGFRESESDWMKDIRDEVLKIQIANVITVDWGSGSGLPYTLAATNTRVVGAECALLIRKLQMSLGADLDRFHIIGFSLGAHAAGYAGAGLSGQIRRISALDPAGPLFEGMPVIVRLDPSDAKFVDAIHTDGKTILELSFGTAQSMGSVDFYPNNGHDQPGCPQSDISKIKAITLDLIVKGLDEAGEEVACRHSRSYHLYLDSLINRENKQVAFPCKSYQKFTEGKCATCGTNGELCGIMGIDAEQFQPIKSPESEIKLYLATGQEPPFIRYHYQIVLSTAPGDSANPFGINVFIKQVSFGGVNVTLVGENDRIERAQITNSNQVFQPETDYRFLVVSQKDLGVLKSIKLTFTSSDAFDNLINLKWNVRSDLRIHSVQVVAMNRLKVLEKSTEVNKYCADTNSLISGRVINFNKSSRC